MTTPFIDKLDDHCNALYLEVPGSKVVLFQAFFDIYESIGVVRTLSIRDSRICIITTPDTTPVALEILNSIQSFLPWRLLNERPIEAEKELFLGYFRKKGHAEDTSIV
jgi:hypothetical protein